MIDKPKIICKAWSLKIGVCMLMENIKLEVPFELRDVFINFLANAVDVAEADLQHFDINSEEHRLILYLKQYASEIKVGSPS